LPGSLTEIYVRLFLDGFLLGVAGLHLYNFRTGSLPANITFAFTTPQEGYRRLHKLTLMSILSTWFWDDVLGKEYSYALAGAPKRL